MKKDDKDLHLEKLKGGLDEKDRLLIDGFFYQLSEQIDLPIVFRSQLIQHFINGFEYYLEQGMKVSDICKLLEVSNLGSFYLEKSRTSYSLDNAAIVYPLGMPRLFRRSSRTVSSGIIWKASIRSIWLKKKRIFPANRSRSFFVPTVPSESCIIEGASAWSSSMS